MTCGRFPYPLAVLVLSIWALAPEANAQYAGAKRPAADSKVAEKPGPNEIVATVNGEPITRRQLADELIEIHGKQHLEDMIGRLLVDQACRAKKIEVTKTELYSELNDFLKRNKLRQKEFEDQILVRQGMTLQRYLRDQIWPKLALLKLVKADGGVQVTDEDLQKAWNANFGEKVECRMMVIHERRRAEEIWKQISDLPKKEDREKAFEDLAMRYSTDEATRPYGGRAAPIGRNTTDPRVEEAAFRLEPGELSAILQMPGGNLLMLCIQKTPAETKLTIDSPVDRSNAPNLPAEIKTYRDLFTKDIERKKLMVEMESYYKKLLKGNIENHLTGDFRIDGATKGAANDPTLDPTVRPTPSAGN